MCMASMAPQRVGRIVMDLTHCSEVFCRETNDFELNGAVLMTTHRVVTTRLLTRTRRKKEKYVQEANPGNTKRNKGRKKNPIKPQNLSSACQVNEKKKEAKDDWVVVKETSLPRTSPAAS
jgi:hypothetical protein